MAEASAPVRFDTLRTASGHAFGRATLDAPASLNALSLAMVDLLDRQLVAWATDPQIAGVILDGTGDKAFCAGGDVVGLYHAIRATQVEKVAPPLAAAFFEREYRLDYRIHRYAKPVLCWGNGIVMGGGVGLLAGASHRVLTPKTRIAMPEVAIGLYPDVGGSWLLARMPGRSGLFLALTGASVNAADGAFLGLANAIIRHDDYDAVLRKIAMTVWAGEQSTDRTRLDDLLQSFRATEVPGSPLAQHRSRIDDLIGDDGLEPIAPRLSALASDADPWLARAGASFTHGSPTSVALGYEMQRRARHLTLADTFRLEWQASVGCCLHHDFAEGVRAQLVDKDKKPRWQPATLAQVTPALIASHLEAHHAGTHPLADLT